MAKATKADVKRVLHYLEMAEDECMRFGSYEDAGALQRVIHDLRQVIL